MIQDGGPFRPRWGRVILQQNYWKKNTRYLCWTVPGRRLSVAGQVGRRTALTDARLYKAASQTLVGQCGRCPGAERSCLSDGPSPGSHGAPQTPADRQQPQRLVQQLQSSVRHVHTPPATAAAWRSWRAGWLVCRSGRRLLDPTPHVSTRLNEPWPSRLDKPRS